MPRSNIYVDGFNLYYGALKSGPCKWLNLSLYFQRLRQDDEIGTIHYFTALIDGPWTTNQMAYLRALATLNDVTVHMGRFKRKSLWCRVRDCEHDGPRRFSAWEEKRTDVHIAVQMLLDAYEDKCDNLVVVSGDSDLVPALNAVKSRFPDKKLIVYIPSRDPTRGAAVELRGAADKHRDLPMALLAKSQFPAELADRNGDLLKKPVDWL